MLVTAQDGGLLLLGRDGVLWLIPPEEQVKHTTDDTPFTPLTRDEMSQADCWPSCRRGSRCFTSHYAHYLIFYDTSPAYAQVVRIAVRAALHGVHQFLDPQGI